MSWIDGLGRARGLDLIPASITGIYAVAIGDAAIHVNTPGIVSNLLQFSFGPAFQYLIFVELKGIVYSPERQAMPAMQ